MAGPEEDYRHLHKYYDWAMSDESRLGVLPSRAEHALGQRLTGLTSTGMAPVARNSEKLVLESMGCTMTETASSGFKINSTGWTNIAGTHRKMHDGWSGRRENFLTVLRGRMMHEHARMNGAQQARNPLPWAQAPQPVPQVPGSGVSVSQAASGSSGQYRGSQVPGSGFAPVPGVPSRFIASQAQAVPGSSGQSRAPIPVPPHLIVRSNAPAGSSGRPQAPIPVPQHLIVPSQGDPAGPVPAPVPFAGAAGMHPVAQQAGDAERAWAAGELNKNNSTFMQTLNEAQIGSLERLRTSPGHPFFTEVATKLPHEWRDPRSIQLLTEWRENGGRAPSSEQQGGPVQYQQHAGSLARGR